jgi:hypothetical protein
MVGPGYPKPIPEAAMRALSDMRDFLPYKGYNLLDTQWIISGGSPAITRLRGLDEQDYELELRAELRASPTPGTGAPNPANIAVRFVLRDAMFAPNPANIAVRFVLRDAMESSAGDSKLSPLHPKELEKADATTLEIGREIFQLERERDELQVRMSTKQRQVEVGAADPAEMQILQTRLTSVLRRIPELKKLASESAPRQTGRTVIDTSFQMTDGETVVVGTSKVKGGGKALIALLTATTDRKATTK